MKKIMTIALMALTTAAFAQLKDGKYIVDYKTSKVDWRGENFSRRRPRRFCQSF